MRAFSFTFQRKGWCISTETSLSNKILRTNILETVYFLIYWHVCFAKIKVHKMSRGGCRVQQGQGCQQTWKVREIWYFFKVRELSGNFENWSVKNKNPQKSGKGQGKIILNDTFFLLLLHVLAMAVFLHWIFNWKLFIIIIFYNCKIKQTF